MISSRKVHWAGRVARIGRIGILVGYDWENQKERSLQEDQKVGGWIILKLIFERLNGGVWTGSCKH
jgi:hypothetical protein